MNGRVSVNATANVSNARQESADTKLTLAIASYFALCAVLAAVNLVLSGNGPTWFMLAWAPLFLIAKPIMPLLRAAGLTHEAGPGAILSGDWPTTAGFILVMAIHLAMAYAVDRLVLS